MDEKKDPFWDIGNASVISDIQTNDIKVVQPNSVSNEILEEVSTKAKGAPK